jgi:tetratricopeptide (TPR) repeat protein
VGIAQLPFILPFALAGLGRMGRRIPRWLLALLVVHVATLMLFYVSNRYRLPLEVLLLVPAAVGIATIRERATQLWIVPGALVAIALLVTTSPDAARAARGKILVNLGTSLAKREQYADAEGAFRAALTQDPTWARAHHYLGRSLALQGRNDAAIDAYGAASRLAPEAIDVKLDLVTALGRGGRRDDAVEQLADAERLAAARDDAASMERAAQLWIALGEPSRAAEAYELIATRRPTAAAWERLGIAHGLAGEPDAAYQALVRAIEIDPSRVPAWEALIRALYELDRCADARARLREAPARSGAEPAAFAGIRAELEAACEP